MDYTNAPELNGTTTNQFWCWKHKLQGILQLLSLLSGYVFSEIDADIIAQELHNTSVKQRCVYLYDLSGVNGVCQVSLSIDDDDSDIVFVGITAATMFQERIQFLAQIQSHLNSLEIDFT